MSRGRPSYQTKRQKSDKYLQEINAYPVPHLKIGEKYKKRGLTYWRRTLEVLSVWIPDLDGDCVFQGPYYDSVSGR